MRPKDYVVSEETREKMRKAMTGKKHTEETKKKISENRKGKCLGNTHALGHIMPESQKLAISKRHKGTKHSEEWNRKIAESQRGEKCKLWQGGKSFEPYCVKFNNEFKERVRNFFGRRCVECGAVENGKKLSVHHVNFNKQTCCDDTIPLFVPLCASCHSKTQKNRSYWEEKYTKLINEQYGGKCYLPK